MRLQDQQNNSVSSGIRWSAIGEYSTQGITFVVYIVLARLLTPRDFGLLAMAMVFIGITEIFSRLGTNTIVIQQKKISNDLLSTLFFLNLMTGVLVGGLLLIVSPLLGRIVQNSDVIPILRVLALTFVITSISSVHEGLLRRNLQFKRIATIQLSLAITKGVVAITLALLAWQVWALVFAVVVDSVLRTIFLFIATGWMPALKVKWSEIQRVKSMMLQITGFGVFNSFANRASNLIIGRFLGATPLGYFSLAYKLYTLPNQYVSHVVGRVLLSKLSAVQDNNYVFRQTYLRACAGVAMFTFPLSIGLAVIAKPFVLTLYGAKWSAAIPVITVLSFVASIHSIAVLTGNIFIAKGRTGIWLIWGIVAGGISALSVFLGLPWGLFGVSVAFGIGTLFLVYGSLVLSFRLIHLHLYELFSVVKPFAVATLLMALGTLGIRSLLDYFVVPQITVLGVCIAVSIAIYGLVMIIARPTAFSDFLELLPHLHNRRYRPHGSASK